MTHHGFGYGLWRLFSGPCKQVHHNAPPGPTMASAMEEKVREPHVAPRDRRLLLQERGWRLCLRWPGRRGATALCGALRGPLRASLRRGSDAIDGLDEAAGAFAFLEEADILVPPCRQEGKKEEKKRWTKRRTIPTMSASRVFAQIRHTHALSWPHLTGWCVTVDRAVLPLMRCSLAKHDFCNDSVMDFSNVVCDRLCAETNGSDGEALLSQSH